MGHFLRLGAEEFDEKNTAGPQYGGGVGRAGHAIILGPGEGRKKLARTSSSQGTESISYVVFLVNSV